MLQGSGVAPLTLLLFIGWALSDSVCIFLMEVFRKMNGHVILIL